MFNKKQSGTCLWRKAPNQKAEKSVEIREDIFPFIIRKAAAASSPKLHHELQMKATGSYVITSYQYINVENIISKCRILNKEINKLGTGKR